MLLEDRGRYRDNDFDEILDEVLSDFRKNDCAEFDEFSDLFDVMYEFDVKFSKHFSKGTMCICYFTYSELLSTKCVTSDKFFVDSSRHVCGKIIHINLHHSHITSKTHDCCTWKFREKQMINLFAHIVF